MYTRTRKLHFYPAKLTEIKKLANPVGQNWGCGGGITRTRLYGEQFSISIKVSPLRLSNFTSINLLRQVYVHMWEMT